MRTPPFGGLAALVITLGTLLFNLLVLFTPSSAVADGLIPWSLVASDYVLALVGLFGLAAVPALTAWAAPLPTPWLRWLGVLAQLGFAVLAVTSFWQAEYELALLAEAAAALPPPAAFPGAAPTPQAGLFDALLTRAPQGWLDAGLIGVWMLGLGFALLEANRTPALAHLGLAAGFFSLSTALGATLGHAPLHLASLVAGGLVLTPLWFAAAGVELLRVRRPATDRRLVAPGPPPPRTARRRWADRSPMLRRIWNLHGDGS